MPEGDTVANTAHALQKALRGQVIRRSDFRTPRLATVDVSGWTVAESAVRGKHLLLRLTPPPGSAKPPHTLHSHLRMDGTWRIFKPGERWHGRPAHTVRVVLECANATAVGFHLHDVALIPTSEEDSLVGHLGPDLLGPDWDPDEAARRLAEDPNREIAEALLDQRNLAGIGNVYKCEVLFLRGVSPWRRVVDVPDLKAIAELSHRLLKSNVGRWSQVTTGSLRRGEEHYVYGRQHQPCRRCGTLIRMAGQGDRITYWCPSCQPA